MSNPHSAPPAAPLSPSSASSSSTRSSVPGLSGHVRLPHMGIIRATGEDAVKFLQGQLTQDVASLSLSEARLAAFCNAKGRVQASFIVFKRANEDILMVCAGDILAQTLKRLSMFVMRAKVKLSDASAEFALYGLTGAAADQWVPGAAPWSRQDTGPASVLRLYPGAGVSRACWCAPADALPPEGPEVPLTYWHGLSVRSGIAMVGQAGYEAFVPQMLNYESVGGVNFKKGCYPGQEVVARSQFRGTLKRRAYVVHAEQALAAGEEVFHAGDPEQPCGLVAAAAPCPDGAGFDAVVSIQTAAAADAADGRLRAASPTGPTLTLRPLPYALLEDI